jgi:hypothetical protein
VKLLQATDGRFVFHVGKREKLLLTEVLGLFPLLPAAHQRLSKAPDAPKAAEHQKLLEEALTAHRQEVKRQVLALLEKNLHPIEGETGFRLSLEGHQVECLLQAVNDVRVGSWVRLGSPDPKATAKMELNAENAPCFWAMEVCGFFESVLLSAVEGSE